LYLLPRMRRIPFCAGLGLPLTALLTAGHTAHSATASATTVPLTLRLPPSMLPNAASCLLARETPRRLPRMRLPCYRCGRICLFWDFRGRPRCRCRQRAYLPLRCVRLPRRTAAPLNERAGLRRGLLRAWAANAVATLLGRRSITYFTDLQRHTCCRLKEHLRNGYFHPLAIADWFLLPGVRLGGMHHHSGIAAEREFYCWDRLAAAVSCVLCLCGERRVSSVAGRLLHLFRIIFSCLCRPALFIGHSAFGYSRAPRITPALPLSVACRVSLCVQRCYSCLPYNLFSADMVCNTTSYPYLCHCLLSTGVHSAYGLQASYMTCWFLRRRHGYRRALAFRRRPADYGNGSFDAPQHIPSSCDLRDGTKSFGTSLHFLARLGVASVRRYNNFFAMEFSLPAFSVPGGLRVLLGSLLLLLFFVARRYTLWTSYLRGMGLLRLFFCSSCGLFCSGSITDRSAFCCMG